MKYARVRDSDGATHVVVATATGPVSVGDGGALSLVEAMLERRQTGLSMDPATLAPMAPVDPPSLRDFMAFEAHIANVRRGQGLEVDPGWYEVPAFYFSNPQVVADQAPVRVPPGARALDYELEVACIVGREASDLDPDDPRTLDVIAGFTLMNDWSARDLQLRDMAQGLGPGKGKDFATSLGMWVVEPDDLALFRTGRPRCALTARVNGELTSTGELADLYYSWGRLLAHASAGTTIRPGDVIGSGTCGTGCLLELRSLGDRSRSWLRPGDVVELRAEGIGTLTNRLVAR